MSDYRTFVPSEAKFILCNEDWARFEPVLRLDDAYAHPTEKPMVTRWTNPGWPPDAENIVGNCGLVVEIDGRWYVATYDWLRYPDQDEKGESLLTAAREQIGQGVFRTWEAQFGQWVGLWVATHCRFSVPEKSPRQRSYVAWVRAGERGIVAHEGESSSVTPPTPPTPPYPPTTDPLEQLSEHVDTLRVSCDALTTAMAALTARLTDIHLWVQETRDAAFEARNAAQGTAKEPRLEQLAGMVINRTAEEAERTRHEIQADLAKIKKRLFV